jgi:1-acyl-sn-glycerol-3-phosphate acyltransferase
MTSTGQDEWKKDDLKQSIDKAAKEMVAQLEKHYTSVLYQGRSPFVARTPWTDYETAKVILMTLTGIAPLRFLMIFTMSIMIWGLSWVAMLQGSAEKPLLLWQRLLLHPCRWLIRAIMFVAGFYWVELDDRRSDQARLDPAPIFVSNHISIWDPFYLYYCFGVSICTKSECFQMPIMGTMLAGAFRGISVERETPDGRVRARATMKYRAGNPLFPAACVFPEGTTHHDGTLIKFKPGVFGAGKPVVPVRLEYPSHWNDLFFGTESMAYYLYLTCCQFINYHKITLLEPYQPSQQDIEDPDTYATHVRDHMAQEFGLAVSEHDYEDYKLFKKYHDTGICDGYTVRKARNALQMTFEQFQDMAQRFIMVADENFVIARGDFAYVCNGIQPSNPLQSFTWMNVLSDLYFRGLRT